jgi:membrane protein DedA with SNARE-associated domain
MSTQAAEQHWAERLLHWAEGVMLALGYPGLALLIAIEQLIPPIPSTLFLPLAGFLASQGAWSLPGVIIAGTVGSLVSALIFYGVGRWLDQSLLDRLLDRYGRWLGVDAARFERVMRQFDRHGPLLVFVGRFVGTVRSLISIPAGMRRMRLAIFLPLTAIGSGLWNTLLAGAGMLLGEGWSEIGPMVARYDQAALAVLALVIAAAVLVKLRQRRPTIPG